MSQLITHFYVAVIQYAKVLIWDWKIPGSNSLALDRPKEPNLVKRFPIPFWSEMSYNKVIYFK